MSEEPEPRTGARPSQDCIAGVYNYCDRWCSACPVSNRCLVFVQQEEPTASRCGPLSETVPWSAQVGYWLRRALRLVHERAGARGIEAKPWVPGPGGNRGAVTPFTHGRLAARAYAYCDAVHRWQRERPVEAARNEERDPRLPQDVIDHFAPLIASKIRRAITSLAWEEGDGWAVAEARDSDGSAKVALLGAERSLAAWADLRDSGLADDGRIDDSQRRLRWLIEELEAVFPGARAFVREGLDQLASPAT